MAGAIVGVARASRDTERRAIEYMPDMADTLAYKSFAPNAATRDGKTLQAPVAGSIPRDHHSFPYGATPDEASRAGRELHNPVPASADALARGRELYETFCLVCHGRSGLGDGPLVPKIQIGRPSCRGRV